MKAHRASSLRRRSKAATFALLVALAPSAISTTVFAQDDAVTKAARARFQEGVSDFDRGDFEAARAAFLEAYALKQHPAVLLNLAQSCLKSGHYLDAAKYFQKYLNDPQGDKKADANKGLSDARAKLGRLDVSAPPGSDVTVDAENVGKAPLSEAVDVEAGNHTVRARLPDGSTSEQKVVVTAGQMQPVRFAAASTVVTPTNPTPTNPENPNPPANPNPTPTNPENPQPPNNPNPIGPQGPLVHPAAAVPLMIGGGVVAVAGFILTGVFAGIKSTANTNYTSVEKQIKDAQVADGINPQTCDPSKLNAAQQTKYTGGSSVTPSSPCGTLKSNQDAVNQDATAANAFAVVGIIGAVAAIGGVVWYFVGAKHEGAPTARITPWIAPGLGGASFSASF
ncbi:MAG TPA: PEGA domain-containing protein [Polyangiaceae bacterium]|jgi:hypothetical protein